VRILTTFKEQPEENLEETIFEQQTTGHIQPNQSGDKQQNWPNKLRSVSAKSVEQHDSAFNVHASPMSTKPAPLRNFCLTWRNA
jgi:hypothetical protein